MKWMESLGLAGAAFSDDGRYRYHLWRRFGTGDGRGRVLFCMLNPSVADHVRSDHTITRCLKYARMWGYGQLDVVNLFAYRATSAETLKAVPDPIGPDNDTVIGQVAQKATCVIAAWGAHTKFPSSHAKRDRDVLRLLSESCQAPIMCLHFTLVGDPGHPLMLPGDLEPIPYPVAEVA